MTKLVTRRSVMAAGAAGLAGSLTTLPISMVRLAFAGAREDVRFTYISDSHIQQIKGAQFVRNRVMGLKRAVAEANPIQPEVDFVMFGGDLAQHGNDRPQQTSGSCSAPRRARADRHRLSFVKEKFPLRHPFEGCGPKAPVIIS